MSAQRWILAVALLVLVTSRPAKADERGDLEVLRQEIAAERAALAQEREALADQRRRIDDVLANMDGARTAQGATPADLPPVDEGAADSGSRLEISGFAMLDAIYDTDRVDPSWKSSLRPSKIPVNCPGDLGCGNDGETILSAKQSRLGFRGYTPTSMGELRTHFEFELYGVGDDAGETTFRIRHAWGELGSIGAGQTWSLFMDPDVFPNTIEYWGPVGMVFVRNPQLRWTAFQSEDFKMAVALEAPMAALDEGKAAQVDPTLAVTDWNKYPDITGQVRWLGDWGHAQLAGIARWPGFEDATAPGFDPDGREFGWGVNLASGLRTSGEDQLLVQLVYGEGIASYMNDAGVDLAPNSALTEAKAVPTIGWLLYYNRVWSEHWTSSFGYSEHRQNTEGGQLADAFEEGEYLNANLLYHPVSNFLLGPEVIWGRRENKDGDDGKDLRFQFSAKYDFGGTIRGN